MTLSLKTCSILASLVAMTGCVSAHADFPEVEVTRENVTFPGVPASVPTDFSEDISPETRAQLGLPPAGEDYQLPTSSFTYDKSPFDVPSQITIDMQATRVKITAHEGTADLSFIRRILLTVTDPGDSQPSVLLEYPAAGVEFQPIGTTLMLPNLRPEQSANPWQAQSSVYELYIWGDPHTLPRQAWAVDVSLTYTGSMSFKY